MARHITQHGVTKCPPVGSPELLARGKMLEEKKGRWVYGVKVEDNG